MKSTVLYVNLEVGAGANLYSMYESCDLSTYLGVSISENKY